MPCDVSQVLDTNAAMIFNQCAQVSKLYQLYHLLDANKNPRAGHTWVVPKKHGRCQEEDFKLRCRLFDWKDGQEDVLWKGPFGWQASVVGCVLKPWALKTDSKN